MTYFPSLIDSEQIGCQAVIKINAKGIQLIRTMKLFQTLNHMQIPDRYFCNQEAYTGVQTMLPYSGYHIINAVLTSIA